MISLPNRFRAKFERPCLAKTIAGKGCGAGAQRDKNLCYWHDQDPAVLRRRRQTSIRGGVGFSKKLVELQRQGKSQARSWGALHDRVDAQAADVRLELAGQARRLDGRLDAVGKSLADLDGRLKTLEAAMRALLKRIEEVSDGEAEEPEPEAAP